MAYRPRRVLKVCSEVPKYDRVVTGSERGSLKVRVFEIRMVGISNGKYNDFGYPAANLVPSENSKV
jgi:hypothetical protein